MPMRSKFFDFTPEALTVRQTRHNQNNKLEATGHDKQFTRQPQ